MGKYLGRGREIPENVNIEKGIKANSMEFVLPGLIVLFYKCIAVKVRTAKSAAMKEDKTKPSKRKGYSLEN